MWARSQTIERRMADRAKIILMSAEGKTFNEICLVLNTSPPVVNKWRKRFGKGGLNGLMDRARPGTFQYKRLHQSKGVGISKIQTGGTL